MNDSNKRTGNVNRQSAAGMGLCISGMGLLAWPVVSQFVGAAGAPNLLLVVLPAMMGIGLIVGGFAMMVAGAEPFEDDGGGVRDAEEPETPGGR